MEISAIATTAHKIILHIRFSSFHCAFSLFYYKMHFVDNIMLLFIFIIYIYEMMLCRSINSKFSAMFTPLLENICRNIFYSFFLVLQHLHNSGFFTQSDCSVAILSAPKYGYPQKFHDSAAKKEAAYTLLLFPYYYLLCFNCLRGLPALFHLQAFPALFRLRAPVRLLLYPSPCRAWVLRWEMSRWA